MEVTIKKVGSTISNPTSNIGCLMYYLSCVNSCLSSGKQLIPSTLTSYQNPGKLTPDEELTVVVLSAILSPDELINVCFFLVPANSPCLCGSLNEFLEIKEASQFVGAAISSNRIAMFKGEKVQTSKVMVFTETWLKKFYAIPLLAEAPRLDILKNAGKDKKRCNKGVRCDKIQNMKSNMDHCQEFTHPCPYQQSCWSLSDPNHIKFYSHCNPLPKCKFAGVCTKMKDHSHREQFHHPGLRDFMVKCRLGNQCTDKNDFVHSHKFSH